MERILLLEDGSIFKGEGFGGKVKHQLSEIVFNTSLSGYQEIISDPSYFNQTIVFTNPMIGNVGINNEDFESLEPCLDGVIVNQLTLQPSNFRCKKTLEKYLLDNDIPGIKNIDTRELTLKIRNKGSMKSILLNEDDDINYYLNYIKQTPYRKDHTLQVMTKRIYEIPSFGKRVVLMDFGCKLNIIQSLVKHNISLIVVPGNTSYEKILSYSPDGILISNGPGDPLDNKQAIENIKKLIDTDILIFGICLGHQLIALASGAKTYKMKFGHRGGNQPVIDLKTNKIQITSQNHSYAVDEESLKNTTLEVSHINLNDKTIEGLKDKKHPVFSVQYHPEAAAGPHDAHILFDQFIEKLNAKENF